MRPIFASARLTLVLALVVPACARGQVWARFDVPDSTRVAAVRDAGAAYEPAWNALLVASLRARAAKADSAVRLATLAAGVARAESLATGGHIATDALRLVVRWSPAQRASRVSAAAAESLGTAAVQARRFDDAAAGFRDALAHYRALGEMRREAWVWGSLAQAAFLRGDLVSADSLYREALRARRAIGDERMVGNALNSIGSTNLLRGRPEVARAALLEARAVRERTGEGAALGATLGYLGLAARDLGEVDSAEVYFGLALARTVAAGDSVRVAEVLSNSASMYVDQGWLERARVTLERGLANVRQRGDRRVEASLLTSLGQALRRQGRFTEAIDRLDEALALRRALGDPRGLLSVFNEAGLTWLGLEDGARARVSLQSSAVLADSLGDGVASVRALNNLALAMQKQGDLGGASRTALRALGRAVVLGDSLLVHGAVVVLAVMAEDARDWGTARSWYERAAAAGSSAQAETRAGDLVNLGNVHGRAGELDRAEGFYRRALDIAGPARLTDVVWPCLIGLGEVEERRGNPEGGMAYLRRAAVTIDALRQEQGAEAPSIALLSRRLFVFDALVHLLQKTAWTTADGPRRDSLLTEAFAWAERGRARALLDRMAESGVPARPADLDAVRRALDPKAREALVAYSAGDSSTSAWVIRPDGWRHLVLPPRPALRARAELLRRALADPQQARSPATLQASRLLERQVIEPLLPALAGVKRLIVVPDGPLARVPFEALLAADPASGAPPRGAWLAERFDIAYEPSASALAARRARPGTPPTGDILVVADPHFGRSPLATLPHTAAEAATLSALSGGHATLLTGAGATKEALLAAPALTRAQVLHLATHGAADEAEPARGGLWLAAPDSAGTAELLSVADVSGLRLAADLVTLSACETGLGRLERGEGVLGLSRAFLAAGAHSVVVSLWSVNDRSTSLLMERFYRRLLGGRASRVSALAEARRALLKAPATASPFYWAPFILVGDPGPLRRAE